MIPVQQSPLGEEKSLSPQPDIRPVGGCVLSLPPRSPQVEGQGQRKDDAHQHQERQPGLQKACTAGNEEEEKGMKERNREVMSFLYVFPPPSVLIKSCWRQSIITNLTAVVTMTTTLAP